MCLPYSKTDPQWSTQCARTLSLWGRSASFCTHCCFWLGIRGLRTIYFTGQHFQLWTQICGQYP